MNRFCSCQRLLAPRLALTDGIRWKATSSRVDEAESSVQDKAVKPFSAIPSPPGSLPFIGHLRLLKDLSLSKLALKLFKEHGKIFRFDFPGTQNIYM